MLRNCQEHLGFKTSIWAAADVNSHVIPKGALLVRPKWVPRVS